ncbi:MAG TPA: YbfB/YjiJ family MFS transporter [Noviherbaspirillum sp.]|uniref:YbfB/YjiJ family MFS transporter n=1 Tax=Noviherbaspirillum sp. TaxID=1926288 RepID=UPI002D60D67A|nr:YbfB/YjiJ family MFS transporter [Noviherbaspirillum sp.]HYD94684.1 YbfB/YjiJ family MFS transporter [Noviherbaspirillum sp.]
MKSERATSWLLIAFAGLCSTLAGLGIGRFSYVATLPLIIDAGWASASGAAQLAAANLIGYLLGALVSHRLAVSIGTGWAIRAAMLVVVVSLICCSMNLGLYWLWIWRLVSGIAGAVLMSMTAPAVLARVPVAMRGKAAGMVFSGIGFGIVLSSFVVPALGTYSLSLAWLALAAITAAALCFAWPRFPVQEADRIVLQPLAAARANLMPRGAMLALICAYSLDAAGYLPHTVFWVEYLVHDLHKSLAMGGAFWALFGVGAAIGPLIGGFAADKFGFRRMLIACFAFKAIGVALPLISTSMPSLFISSLVVGALTPGLGALVSGRAAEIDGTAAHLRSWAVLTFSYSAVQAAGGYVMAGIYAATHSFSVLFAIGASLLALSTIISAIRFSYCAGGRQRC